MNDVIEHARRTILDMTNLSAAHKRKRRSTPYHIVENDDPSSYNIWAPLEAQKLFSLQTTCGLH